MASIYIVTDPFNPRNNLAKRLTNEGETIGQWVNNETVDYRGEPFVFMIATKKGNVFPLRHEWNDTVVGEDECLWVIPHVGGVASIVIAVVVAVAAVVIAVMISQPKVGEQESADPVYSISGQRNQNRANNPIEDPYGRNRLWGSVAAAPYTTYEGNNQHLFQLFCLGQGEYDIEAIQIEDTAIGNFQEAEYELIEPGDPMTLFSNNVITSSEVDEIEMFGPNETNYPLPDGWIGPFTTNESNTDANRIEVDIVFPNGIYNLRDDGDYDPKPIEFEFQYREIDNAGAPVGGWLVLHYESATYTTTQTLRQTFSKEVADARYEVRGRRILNKSPDPTDADLYKWTGLRAFLPSTLDYGNVTLLAVKARATNNLNNNAATRINVIATRKLPIYDPDTQTWSALTATRNPVWAFINILRAEYGGKLPDINIDLEFLAAEADLATTRGDTFDWVYERRVTIWEALKAPAGVMRAVPMLNGSVITLIRDQLRSTPSMMFASENMHLNSFKLEKKLNSQDTEDGLVVEYIDQTTWKTETVDCFLDGELGINPKRLVLRGMTERNSAFQFGMYQRSVDKYERTQTKFATGVEGTVAAYGDLVRVGSDIPRWGQSGHVKSFTVDGANTTGVELSEPVTFTEGEDHVVVIRNNVGTPLQYTVTAGADDNNILFTPPIVDMPAIAIGGNHEPPIFIFGVLNSEGQLCRVVGITPNGEDSVGMTCVVNDDRRFAFDAVDASPLDSPDAPTIPDLPVVTGLVVDRNNSQPGTLQARWSPAAGAQYYVVEWSFDGVIWLPIADTVELSLIQLYTVGGLDHVWFRVAGVNAAAGPWATWDGVLELEGTLQDDVANDLTDDDGRSLGYAKETI